MCEPIPRVATTRSKSLPYWRGWGRRALANLVRLWAEASTTVVTTPDSRGMSASTVTSRILLQLHGVSDQHHPQSVTESVTDWRPGKVSAMAMQSKGSRRMYATRIPVEVGDLIEQRALEAGCTSTSQYLADLLAVVHGRPDLVRELNQEVMPLTA